MSHPFEMADLALADESVVRRTGSVAAPRSAINPAATNFTARSPAPALRLLISIRRARPAEKSRPRRGGRSTPPCFTGKPIRKSHQTVSVPRRSKRGLRSRGRKLGRVPNCSAITSPSSLALRGTLSPVATSKARQPGQIHGRQDR